MKVVFDRSFYKSLDKLKDASVKKKLTGYKTFYRIRIGDYRIGIELEKTDTLRFIVIAHRKDIYTIFP